MSVASLLAKLPSIPFVASAGGDDVVASAIVVFSRSEPVVLRIGALTARFELSTITDGKTKLETDVNAEALTVTYRIIGEIPTSPTTYHTMCRLDLGTVSGAQIKLTWGVSRASPERDAYLFQYTIYRSQMPRTVPAPPAPTNA